MTGRLTETSQKTAKVVGAHDNTGLGITGVAELIQPILVL